MNYERIYNQLINRAHNRNIEGYFERHHIKPKCLGGSNKPHNLVSLTAREHFLAHHLLVKIHPSSHGLLVAMVMMSGKIKNNSKKYESSRVKFGNAISILRTGTHHSEETKRKLSASNTNAYKTDPTLTKRINTTKSKNKIPRTLSQEHRQKISESNKGRVIKHSEITKKKISITLTGRKRSRDFLKVEWKITNIQTGETIIIKDKPLWCEERNFNYHQFYSGTRNGNVWHKTWLCEKLN